MSPVRRLRGRWRGLWVMAMLCLLLPAVACKRPTPVPQDPGPTAAQGLPPGSGAGQAPVDGSGAAPEPSAGSAEDDETAGERCVRIRDAEGTRIDRFLFEEDIEGVASWIRVQELPDLAPQLATLFSSDDKLYAADLVRNSLSGDWFQQLGYCYRADGSLLVLTATINTFHGNKRVVDELRFDKAGASTSSERQVFDLQSGEPVPAEPGSFMEVEPPLYITAADLKKEVGR